MEDIQLNSIEKISDELHEIPVSSVPSEAIQKMAVLFTDIVGSTRFFKTYGNQAGRQMLQRHEEIAGEGVHEHNGVVVKTIGDAILAYFLDPADAVRAAVTVQQKFLAHNRVQKAEKDEIHVRIGVHFGDGIIEKNDIFGNVVNLAAKINPLAGGDQIFVSHTVCELARPQIPLTFDLLDLPGKKKVLKGVRVYEVQWDDTIRFDPTTNTVVYMKPLWQMTPENFELVWGDFLSALEESKDVGLVKHEVVGHQDCILVFREIAHATSKASNILSQIRKRLQGDGPQALLVPIQILIDFGEYLKDGRVRMEQFKAEWDEIEPGYIHITENANRTLQHKTQYTTFPAFDPKEPIPFYKVMEKDGEWLLSLLFPYGQMMVQGGHYPCFYCSSRHHTAGDCPSKILEESDEAIATLRYTPLQIIRQSFFRYLNTKDRDDASYLAGIGRETGDPILAFNGFFDLNMLFQLRFFKTIWTAEPNQPWDRAKQWRRGSGKGGGKLWLALDCLRIADLYRADHLIREAHQEFEKDFRLHCVKAFLNIEKKEIRAALDNFKRALAHAGEPAHRILIYLYLFRIHWLNGHMEEAGTALEHILRIEPRCTEALYVKLVLQFHTADPQQTVPKLAKFVSENPEYFLVTMIDPDLADFAGVIHPQLSLLLEEARMTSRQIVKAVEEEYDDILAFVDKGSSAQRELRTIYNKMIGASESDSYTGFLDIMAYADKILNRKDGILKGQKRRVYNRLHDLKKQSSSLSDVAAALRHYPEVKNLQRQLNTVRKETSQLYQSVDPDDPESCRAVAVTAENLLSDLAEIKSVLTHLKKKDQTRQIIRFFLIRGTLLLTASLVAGYLFVPVYNAAMEVLPPYIKISPYDVTRYRNWAMVLSGTIGLLTAITWTAVRHRSR